MASELSAKQLLLQQQTGFAARMLSRRAYKHEVIRLLKDQYGCSRRTCERILARARALLVALSDKSRDEHRDDALAWYVSVQRDPDASLETKMVSQARINRLLGLEGPVRVGLGQDPDAPPQQVELVERVVRKRDDVTLLERAHKIGGLHLVEEYLRRLETAAATRPNGTLNGEAVTPVLD
jgi:hypothetical protein